MVQVYYYEGGRQHRTWCLRFHSLRVPQRYNQHKPSGTHDCTVASNFYQVGKWLSGTDVQHAPFSLYIPGYEYRYRYQID